MSENPPPLPVSVIPVEPVRVQSIAFDAPYSSAPGRPGVITAIGVMSIIAAVVSMVATLLVGVVAPIYLRVSRVMNTPAGAAPPTYVLPVKDQKPPQLNGAQRQLVMDRFDAAMRRSIGNTPQGDRRRVLGAMLDRAGTSIVGNKNNQAIENLPALQDIRAVRVPSAGDSTRNDADLITLSTGRIELYDRRAIFVPLQGQTVRVTLDQLDEVLPDASGVLPPKYLAAVLEQANTLSQGRITSAQSDELSRYLTAPGQGFVTDLSSPEASAVRLKQVTIGKQGAVLLHFADSGLEIDPAGKLMRTWLGNEVPTAGTATTLLVIDHVMAAVFAAFLIVAGVMTLRQSRTAKRLLWGYVGARLLAAAATGAIWWYYFHTAKIIHASGGVPGNELPAVWIMVSIMVGATCLYPVMLTLMLSPAGVRRYFDPSEGIR